MCALCAYHLGEDTKLIRLRLKNQIERVKCCAPVGSPHHQNRTFNSAQESLQLCGQGTMSSTAISAIPHYTMCGCFLGPLHRNGFPVFIVYMFSVFMVYADLYRRCGKTQTSIHPPHTHTFKHFQYTFVRFLRIRTLFEIHQP